MHETRVFDSELQTYETQVQFFAPKMATLGKSTKGPQGCIRKSWNIPKFDSPKLHGEDFGKYMIMTVGCID